MIEFSEMEMANAFELALNQNRIKGIPNFEILYREFTCQQGIPDFIGLPFEKAVDQYDFSALSSVESSSLILSLLKFRSGRKKEYIKDKTGLSTATLNRVLKELLHSGLIFQREHLFFLSSTLNFSDNSIWTFELKLSNWKRALFQALQNKAFANYSVVVFPVEKEKILSQNIDVFRDLNVGVLLFDISSGHGKWLRRPRREKSVSKWQTFFFIGKVLCQKSKEIHVDHKTLRIIKNGNF